MAPLRRFGNTTPEQWELGGDILDQGERHPAIKAIKDRYVDILKALAESAQRSMGMKRIGVGRTEDPTLDPRERRSGHQGFGRDRAARRQTAEGTTRRVASARCVRVRRDV